MPAASPRRDRVVILLAAHNGAPFLAAQIGSIRAQRWREWLLIVRDDASSDDSRAIVASLAARDERIVLLPADARRLGAAGSFGALLAEAQLRDAEYVLLSDQDDVWLPGRIERCMAEITARERAAGSSRPLLVHSDLRVVDERLNTIHTSYRSYQRVGYDSEQPLHTLLLRNAATGCTFLFNRALLDFALPLPAGAAHDWWLAQCAAAAGEIGYVDEALVLYRQHGANVVGSPGSRTLLHRLAARPWRIAPRLWTQFRTGVAQATELHERIRERSSIVTPARAEVVGDYARVYATRNPVRRLYRVLRSGVRPRRKLSHLFFYPLVLMQPASSGAASARPR
jgi:rhamnosyltransferase